MQQRRANAGRIAGLHFFNPAPKMPLVEVVAGEKTSEATIDKTCALAVGWGKYPIVVADSPGFLVNRCLMPYMRAALLLLEAGEQPTHVDGALKHFGMPMGAIELADRVGLDICSHVGHHLSEAFGARLAMPAWFDQMVADGLLGEKSGGGFFTYQRGKHAKMEQGAVNSALRRYLPHAVPDAKEFDADMGARAGTKMAMTADAIVDACLLPMLVEALACLQEEVVSEPDHLDAAFVYGVGFPAFRGGLLHYFAGVDRAALVQKIETAGLPLPENLDLLDHLSCVTA